MGRQRLGETKPALATPMSKTTHTNRPTSMRPHLRSVRCAVQCGLALALASWHAFGQVPSTLQQHLFPTDGQSRVLGSDLDADQQTLVAGGTGRVYVYTLGPGGRVEMGVLEPPTVVPRQDRFGLAVAVSGDLVAVGSQNEKTAPGAFGAVHIYRRLSGQTSTFLQTLNAPVVAELERSGTSLGLDGTHLVVGDTAHRFGLSPTQGAAYAFEWFSHEAILASTDVPRGDEYGQATAIEGNTILTGAPQEDISPNLGDGGGAVYVYQRVNDSWLFSERLQAVAPESGARFGSSVALDHNQAVIGAASQTVKGQEPAGKVHLFFRTTSWNEVASFTSDDPVEQEQFGTAVSIVGNVAMGGRPGYSPVGIQTVRGGARVMKLSAGMWAIREDLAAPDDENLDQYGSSVLVYRGELIVGAALVDVPVNGDTIPDWGRFTCSLEGRLQAIFSPTASRNSYRSSTRASIFDLQPSRASAPCHRSQDRCV